MSEFQQRPRKKRMSTETRNFLIFLGSAVLVIVIAIVITVAVFFKKNAVESGIPSEDDSGSLVTVEETEYDPEANKLDVEKYSGVILPASEDGGEDYLKETLFIGDSNTYRYMLYGKVTLKNAIGVVGMGIQDVTKMQCVKFVGYSEAVTIPEAVGIMQPRRIVLGFGTNNADGDWSAEYFAQQYQQALDAIHNAYPYADIIIGSIPPIAKNHSSSINMTAIDAYNAALVAIAEQNGYKFLNSSEALKDEQTGFAKDNYTIEDGYHLNQQAVESYFQYVRTHTYITEDTRPALTAIPQRDETEPYVITDGKVHLGTVSGTAVDENESEEHEGLEIVYTVNDSAMGSITGTATQYVPEGTAAEKVTATPTDGYVFAYWECTVGHIDDVYDPNLTFVSPGGFGVDKVIVTANFTQSGCIVRTSTNIEGVGTAGILVSGNEIRTELNVEQGTAVNLKAYVNDGYGGSYEFVGWMNRDTNQFLDGSGKNDFSFTPTASINLMAVFQAKSYSTNVTTDGSKDCSVTKQINNGVLTVTATAAEGYAFERWTVNGEVYSQDATTTITVNQDLEVVAHFKSTSPFGEDDSRWNRNGW